ncbi:Hypothetical protein SRAE_2000187900 [Strongyloides ratti]|uniref:Uncharacterized protein n=1 Tax=Strongyloides ratti TaxID=34506 RepID=A0A090MYH9_STRRB|nr:Hypothetical protein SRAE_2000187900 [Strongyloides ratti]CEF67214.1 Hypothetical protein SRAE_2000187900 [Strongyloides ratti]
MINDHPQYYWYFPYEDITDFKNGFIHEEFCVNIWRVIIIIFLILLILLITLTWYLYECKKKEDIKINKRKKENECIQNLKQPSFHNLSKYPLKNYNINHVLCRDEVTKSPCCLNDEGLAKFNNISICTSCNVIPIENFYNSCTYQSCSHKNKINCNCINFPPTMEQCIVAEKEQYYLPLTRSCKCNKKCKNSNVNDKKGSDKDILQLNMNLKDIEKKDVNIDYNLDKEDENKREEICILKC